VKQDENRKSQTLDRIEDGKIILYDNSGPGHKILKKVEIITSSGKKRDYKIVKTVKGG
jgi:hypothetical protein